jgi:serine protease Do
MGMRAGSIALVAAGLAGGVALALGLNERLDTGAAEAGLLAGQSAASAEVPTSAGQINLSFAPVARAAQPSVVNIFTARVVRERGQMGAFFRTFESQPRVANSLGSGVIVDGSGLVVTNNHVVQAADQIVVALADRREYPARVLFAEPRLDLALLQLESRGAALPVARLGDSDRAQVGDLVLAIGNPFGVGQTVTQGIVSATARTGIGISDTQFFIQTDAAINQGNSGGALLAMNGDVIGINTAILTGGDQGGSIGLGFAVPSNMVKSFLRAAATGKFVTAWIGAEGEALTGESAARAGLARPTGMLLTGVTPGSPADRAGLRAGDIIAAIDGKEVTDPASLRYQIATQPLGEEVTLTVWRDRAERRVTIRLAPPPENPPRQLTRLPAGSLFGGLAVANLSPALAQELGAGLPERGVVLVDVPQQTFLARLLRRGDLIEQVNGQPVATVGELAAALQAAPPAEVQFVVNRFGQRVACAAVPGRGLNCRNMAPRFAGELAPGA